MTQCKMDSDQLLYKAAVRVAQESVFMASALEIYAGGKLDFGRRADLLQADQSSIVKLALCKRPNPEATSFASDVMAVASASGVSPAAVANALRHVEALTALKESSPGNLLAAARDHIDSNRPDETEDS